MSGLVMLAWAALAVVVVGLAYLLVQAFLTSENKCAVAAVQPQAEVVAQVEELPVPRPSRHVRPVGRGPPTPRRRELRRGDHLLLQLPVAGARSPPVDPPGPGQNESAIRRRVVG